MIAIGSYFIFIVSVMGVICVIPEFSNEENNMFYNYMLIKHNSYRNMHNLKALDFSDYVNRTARQYLAIWMKDPSKILNEPTVNTFSMKLSENSKLDDELAKKIVDDWYNTKGDSYKRIVWITATELGVLGAVQNDNLYVVAYYYYIDRD